MATQNNQDVNVKVENNEQPPQNNGENQGGQNRGGYNRGGGRGAGRFGNRGGRGGERGGGRFGGPRGDDNRIKNENNFGGPRKRGPPGENQRNDKDGGDRPDRGDGGDRGDRRERGPRPMVDKFMEKIAQMGGPSYDIPPINTAEKKFNGRNRLYIGNIGNETSEEELVELFKPFGETSEIFMNKEKNFAFIKLDYHSNAERAKRELDGTVVKNRNLKIRFAPNSTSIKVRNLNTQVSNELLHYAFGLFGEIEKAIVCVDERGKPTGDAIIDFARKGSAMACIRKCSEGCFFLTSSLRPCIVELYEAVDDNDGHADKNVNKKNPEYMKEREVGPRFASPGSFEHEYGTRWKQLYDLYQQKEQALKQELDMEKEKLEAQMEYARYEHETEMLREQLRAREMDRERQKREWEMKERQAEEQRQRTEEQMRRQQEEMEGRMQAQEEEMRRRQQENNLFMKAHNLDSMLNQQEEQYEAPSNNYGSSHDNVMDPKAFMSSYERNHNNSNNRYEGRDSNHQRGGGGSGGGGSSGGGNQSRGHWVNDNRRDDFQNKRRRF